jgi:hypothetical protein
MAPRWARTPAVVRQAVYRQRHSVPPSDGLPMAHDALGVWQLEHDLWLLQALARRWGLGTPEGDAAPVRIPGRAV